jgi:gliding motility-associated-like protein
MLFKVRVVLLFAFLLVTSKLSFAQGCNCPLPASCAPCQGGISAMTLRYTGVLAVAITVSDQGGIIYVGALVTPGSEFSFVGSNPLDKFLGPTITVTVNALPNATIGTNCASGVAIGNTYGSFQVVGLSSLTGGTMCCPSAIIDSTAPVISGCPTNITQPAGAACNAAVSWTVPTAIDDCTLSTFTSTHNPGAIFPIGNTNVSYTATDVYGNASTCNFTVTVTDNTPPVIASCPANINLFAAANCKAIASWTAPTASDNCSVSSFTSTHTSGSEFNLGSTTVNYTATDAAGNTSTCSFVVTVTDNTPPVIANCPANINLFAAANCKAVATWTTPTASDNCTVSSFTSTHASGTEFNLGSTTVTYTAIDAAGNSSTCSFTVTVTDNTAPVIANCPANINLFAAANCKAVATWTTPTASDNCTVSSFTSTHASGTEFNLGSTTVTYTAIDAAGNSSTCSFTVTVTDNTAPVIANCPANINLFAAANCKAIATWTAPTASDNCTVSSFTSTHASGTEFNLGSTTVTYTATDAAGNSSTCSFIVNVSDNEAPIILNCPSDITIPAASNCKAFATWTMPSTTDNCGFASLTSSHASGFEFDIGITTVTYTAQDNAGNVSRCTFDVIVTRNQTISISGCPEPIELLADETGTSVVDWTEPLFSVVCGSLTIERTHIPGARFPVGLTNVEYRAIDPLGNTAVCTFTINVTLKDLVINLSQLVTPDGDGYNDTWQIFNIDQFTDSEVIVYDRWGNQVFKTIGYNNDTNGWDGTRSGNPLPTGTYFYYIQVKYGDRTAKKEGFIELVR